MADPKNEFTNITKLQPEAQGEPGKRTFRIIANSESSSASMWLEKEQLFQLAVAIQRLIATLPEDLSGNGTSPAGREAPGLTQLDFKVGRLVLGHDGGNDMFIIEAHDVEDGEDDAAILRVWVNKEQIEGFAEEAFRVCAAGRPICPLCGRPKDPEGHLCIRVNGHRPDADISEQEEP